MDSNRNPIILPIGVAFLLYLLAGPGAQTGLTNAVKNVTPGVQRKDTAPRQTWISVGGAVGWAVTFMFLTILSDVEPTRKPATMFSWLIFASIALTLGPSALGNIQAILNSFTGQKPSNLPNISPVKNHPGRGGQP